MSKKLPGHDQETIITFNNEEELAYIFTYDKVWQSHLEKRLGLKPVMNNGSGGKEYQLDKKLIPMPRAKRKPSGLVRRNKSRSLPKSRVLKAENIFQIRKTGSQMKSGDDFIPPIKKEVVKALLRY